MDPKHRFGRAVCILGMHRSGTSSLTRVLNLLGVELGRNLMPPAEDNPKGFWEHADIAKCHGQLLIDIGSYFDDILPLPVGWERQPLVQPFRDRLLAIVRAEFSGKPLWGFKDPRACRLVALWDGIFTQLKARPGYVLMLRHPQEIAASLIRRNGQGYNQSLLMTLGHMLESERQTRRRPRVVVGFDEVMADWRSVAARIGSALSIQWPNSPDAVAGQVSQFLDPSLRHHRTADLNGECADARLARWTDGVYTLLAAAAIDPNRIDEPALDQIAAEFNAALPEFAGWRSVRTNIDGLERLRLDTVRLKEEAVRLEKDNKTLRQEADRWRTVAMPADQANPSSPPGPDGLK